MIACKDCKYYLCRRSDRFSGFVHICTNPKYRSPYDVNFITGKYTYEASKCVDVRRDKFRCGPEAKDFEIYETKGQRLLKSIMKIFRGEHESL